jgi:hypothetical protein
MGRSPKDLSWEIMWRAKAPKDSEDRPLSPPSLVEAVLGGTVFAVAGVNFAVRSGDPTSLVLVLFAFVWMADALPIRRYRGPHSHRRSGAAPLPEWARRRAR